MVKATTDANKAKLLTLIGKEPKHRQTYSDCMAWLMACLSELAYEKFESLDKKGTKDRLRASAKQFLNAKDCETLSNLMDEVCKHDPAAIKEFKAAVESYGLKVKEAYNRKNTQAFLAESDDYLVLVFRGTEKNNFCDIKTGLNARRICCKNGGHVHRGFSKAYDHVADQIQRDLNNSESRHKPLIITGHSLGGALATIATKRLKHAGGIAACYTFGMPRVCDEEWSYTLNTPIYRLVNAIDCIPMLPFSGQIVAVIQFFVRLIPKIGFLADCLKYFAGYIHVGDMRYLTNCPPNNYENMQITYHVNLLRRLRVFVRSRLAYKFIKDHAISVYRKKLAILAERRSQV